MRLFIAVFPSADCVERLRAAMDRLRKAAPRVRWVRPEDAHFTLAFMGETSAEGAEKAARALDRACGAARPFRAVYGEPGAFASWERPRIVWLGLKEGAEELDRLARAARSELGAEGLAFDPKPFVPHLTLGRLSGGRPPEDFREIARRALAPAELSSMEVTEVVLVSSKLTPQGPEYRALRRRGLAPEAA